MLVRFSRHFQKSYDKASLKVKSSFDARLELFIKDSFNPTLNNHSLKGSYIGFRSINITGDWRAIYSEEKNKKGDKTVIFEILGTHSQLYR